MTDAAAYGPPVRDGEVEGEIYRFTRTDIPGNHQSLTDWIWDGTKWSVLKWSWDGDNWENRA